MTRRALAIILTTGAVLLAAVGALLYLSSTQTSGPCEIGFVRTANGCEQAG